MIHISVETLSVTIFVKKIPILSPLFNFIHTGMDENLKQSKVNKSANVVASSIVNIFLANYALYSYKKVCVVLNFCPWCKHHFPLVLLLILMKNAFYVKKDKI